MPARTPEGCPPKSEGQLLQAPSNGASRWMVIARPRRKARREQNPAHRPARSRLLFPGWGGGTADASVRRIVRVFRGLWSLRVRQFLRVLCVSDFLPVARGHLPCACSRTGAAADFFGFPAAGSATNPAVKSHQPQRSGFALVLKAGAGKTPGLLPAPAFKINANPVACYACDLTAENRDRLCGVGGYPRPSGRFHRLRRGFRWGRELGNGTPG